ncbi:unnamed protein product [Rhizoctonia solani]|uniref:MARVEL domain-containing protein n=1 Tax=Rhizoctonia solani TaxID=456999 RepID=A0A8H3A732_9AGAM|nr:unnamed protein product [Rhizoctonia solani]
MNLNLFNKLRLCLFGEYSPTPARIGSNTRQQPWYLRERVLCLGYGDFPSPIEVLLQAYHFIVRYDHSAYLTSRLFSTGLHDFLIFSLVVSAFTIVIFVLLALRSQPRIDAVVLFILVGLWLTMGAYSQDVIGREFCYSLRGETIPAKNDTTMSAENYCRQMKTVLAFSWANFVFLALWLLGLLTVVIKIYARGDRDIWRNSMSDVTILTENPMVKTGEYPMGTSTNLPSAPGQTYVYYPSPPNISGPLQPQIVQQQPGHSVIIRNGQVTQVPGSVVSA